MDHRRSAADYIASLLKESAMIARMSRLNMLAKLLEIAELQARQDAMR